MRTLDDLIGTRVKITFRSKSASQFKAYNILDYADGFFLLQGIVNDAGELGEAICWQNVAAIDVIQELDVKPGIKPGGKGKLSRKVR